jgi:large subunit ribosomal protein L2
MKQLKEIKKKNSGRNSSGKVVVRHQGGQQKRYYRTIDFRRDKIGISGKVVAIEYDPNRTVDIALVHYSDGEKRYMLAPQGLVVGAVVVAGKEGEIALGNALPMNVIPVGTIVHNIELTPGKGGQMARSAGTAATIQAKEGNFVHLRLPSGEVRRVPSHGMATIGQLGNIDKKNEKVGKAGRNRHRGIRPTVRGTAQNPRSHPHGGGEARSGVGLKSPKTYAGKIAVGKRRRPNKYSDKYIVSRRKGKKRG